MRYIGGDFMRDHLHKIPKETLTVKNIKQDIKEKYKTSIAAFLLLIVGSLIFLAIGRESWTDDKVGGALIGGCGLLFLFCGISMLLFPLIGRKITSKKLVIVEDWLVDIREDVEYRHRGPDRPYYEFSFAKGSKYRLYLNVYGNENYKWSKMYAMSNQGIYNYSQIDDDFYLVFSNEKKNNLLLIYNKKIFEFSVKK